MPAASTCSVSVSSLWQSAKHWRKVSAIEQEQLDDFSELEWVVVRDRDGTALHAGGVPSDAALSERFLVPPQGSHEIAGSLVSRYQVRTPESHAGVVDIGMDTAFVRSKLEDLALDLAVIVLVALVVGYEVALSVSERVAGRQRRGSGLADIRIVLFVFVVAEELSKSFLPQLTLSTTEPGAVLDPAIAVSLPIVAYLLTLGLASPFAGRLATSLGERRLLLMGFARLVVTHHTTFFINSLAHYWGRQPFSGRDGRFEPGATRFVSAAGRSPHLLAVT